MHLLLGGVGLDIASIVGLTGWWAADEGVFSDAGTTPAVDTNTVQQWNGKVVAVNLTQAAAGNRPTYRTNILNGKPVIRFGGGTDDDFFTTSNLSAFFAVGAKTGFIVSKWTANTDSSLLGSDAETVFVQHTTSGSSFNFYNLDAGGADTASIGALTGGNWYVASFLHSAGSIYMGANDTRTASMGTGTSGDTTTLATPMTIGRRGAGTTQYDDGDIAEIILFNVALDESTRVAIERFLASKYAITLGY